METLTISLDGREVAGTPGTTILDLAAQVGVEIPTLCHHPLLKSAGACRVCLVEEVKTGRLLASCVTPIAEGMEILSESPAAVQGRRGALELILSDHPSACVICNKGNECDLRMLAKNHGICDAELDPIRRWRPTEEVNPFIVRDLTKCVMCGRCIRVCKDFEAVGAVEYIDRGYASHPGTARGTPLDGSECNFCGSCVAICPTDALAERIRQPISSGKSSVRGVCAYCGTGCLLEYELADGLVTGARGVLQSPVNSLSLCVRGRYGQDALSSPARLTDPLIRDEDGTLKESSWDEALGEVADRLRDIIDQHGPSSIGVIVGTQCSNEEQYLAIRFSRSVLETPNVDAMAVLCSGAVASGLAASLKGLGPDRSLEGILEADTIFLIGARPDYTHPVIARNVRRAVRNRGAALIRLDPLTTSLSPFTRINFKEDIDEQPRLLAQLMKELVAARRHDEEFLLANVKNAADFIAGLRPHAKERDATAEVKQAAHLMGKGRRTVFLIGPVVAGSTHGYILSRLVADLALLCGQPGNIFLLLPGCNEMGTWEIGFGRDGRPGCVIAGDPEGMKAIRRVWGSDVGAQRGLDAMGMLHGAEQGNVRALLFLGVDPLAVLPDTERTRKTLSAMDLVVRTGMFQAVGEECAGIVFPSAAITEADGTYMNVESRVQRCSKITDPPGNARPNARLLLDLAGMFDKPMGFLTARDIFDEMRSVCARWNKLTWADTGKPGGVSLEYTDDNDSSGDAVDEESLFVPYTLPDSFPAPPEAPADRPWKVFMEERSVFPGDGVISTRSRRLASFETEPSVRMNLDDAGKIGAENGTLLLLRSEVGEVKARVAVDPDVPRGGIVIPAGGPAYMAQRLLSWPEEYCPPGWDRLFVTITKVEE